MNRRLIATIAVILLIAASIFWLFQFRQRTEITNLTRVSLRLQWLDQAQFAGFYVAAAKGFYKKRGLDVEINPGGPDFNAMTLVASGSDTFGIWTGDQIALGMSKGLPLVPIAAIFDQSLAAFMVKADSSIRSPKDFEGHTVGMYYGYDTETIYLELLKRFGVDRTKVRETPVQFDLGRFFTGDVDVWPAYVINQPIAAEQNGIKVRLLTPKQYGIKYYSDVLFTRSDYLQKNSEIVSAFLSATVEGWTYALAHRDEATDIVMARAPNLNREQQRKMLDVVGEYLNLKSNSKFLLDPATWQSIESLLTNQGLLKQTVPIPELIRGNDVSR
ncbi:ABC transporter substrate-binding protein [Bradyrhizobium nitroreducens]|uniref:ABC transporter substrate-binding protein n=1 Tax=Bradyrhizobium nitroreducens TaxID=709803 RepID=UPI000C1EC51B|nr:ABC transporter substrate-binding protein [Bradyrhizobium nitroreducens]